MIGSCSISNARRFVPAWIAIWSPTAHAFREAHLCCSFTSTEINLWRVYTSCQMSNYEQITFNLPVSISKLKNSMVATTLVTPWDHALGVFDSRHFFNMATAISSTGYLGYLETLNTWMGDGRRKVRLPAVTRVQYSVLRCIEQHPVQPQRLCTVELETNWCGITCTCPWFNLMRAAYTRQDIRKYGNWFLH